MTPAALAPGEGVPRPEGWIGTVDQWTQGLGIALVLLNLIVLVLAWRRLRRSRAVRPALGLLFIGLAVLPVIAIFLGFRRGVVHAFAALGNRLLARRGARPDLRPSRE